LDEPTCGEQSDGQKRKTRGATIGRLIAAKAQLSKLIEHAMNGEEVIIPTAQTGVEFDGDRRKSTGLLAEIPILSLSLFAHWLHQIMGECALDFKGRSDPCVRLPHQPAIIDQTWTSWRTVTS
jgi:hypothetical protein